MQETRIVTYIHSFFHKWNQCVLCRKSHSNWPRVLTRHSPPQPRDHGSSYQAVQASISFQLKSDKTNGECFLTLPSPHYIIEDPQDNGTNVIHWIHIVYYIHTGVTIIVLMYFISVIHSRIVGQAPIHPSPDAFVSAVSEAQPEVALSRNLPLYP